LTVIRRTIRSAQRDPDPVSAARTLTRGTTIVGLMLEDLGDQQPAGKRFGRWVIRAGQIAWGIVELAAPRSLGEVLFQYWVWLIYALALAMILIGVLTDAAGVGRVGAIVGAIALAGHALVLALRKWMTGAWWILGFWLPVVLGTTVSSVYLLQAMKATGVTTEMQDLRSIDDVGKVRRALIATIMKEKGVSTETAGTNATALAAEADARFSVYLRDDTLFIPTYTALIIALATGLGFASKRFMARPHAAIALVAAAALATATADLIENSRAWLLLGLGARSLPYTTNVKFAFLRITIALLLVLAAMAAFDWSMIVIRSLARWMADQRLRSRRRRAVP
jgi:hypothetical protein